jgi:hypothetical protein
MGREHYSAFDRTVLSAFDRTTTGSSAPARPIVDSVVPNPKLKLLDPIREVMRLKG